MKMADQYKDALARGDEKSAPMWTSCEPKRHRSVKFRVWRYTFPDGSTFDERVPVHQQVTTP